MSNFANAAAIAISLLFTFTANAQTLPKMTQLEIFNRCYNRLVKMPLPVSGNSKGFELVTAVRNGSKTGTQACMDLITFSQFAASGEMTNRNSDEARRVLETFHNLHISFFGTTAMGTHGNLINMTLLLKDIDEPALYFTQALFANRNPATILTSTETLRSIRESNYTAGANFTSRSIDPFHFASYPANGNPRTLSVWEHDNTARETRRLADLVFIRNYYKADMDAAVAANDTEQINQINSRINSAANTTRNIISFPLGDNLFIGQGPMLGIKSQSPLMIPVQPLRTSIAANGSTATITTNYQNHNFYWHLGGGVLGTQMYMLKNTNLGVNSIIGGTTANDTYANVPRRFTSKIFEDLLCHTLPTLNVSDVQADVDVNSNHGFRQTASCMRCHSSFDPLAGVYRNIIVGQTSGPMNNDPQLAPGRGRGSPAATLIKMESTTQNIYSLRAPTAALRFRDHTGALTNKSVSSVAQLGTELSKSGDFYRCMAKRYYHFLTGISVNLTSADAELSAAQKKHKDFVYLLGRMLQGEFKDTNERNLYQSEQRSLQGLIKVILNSDTFASRDLGTLGE